MITDKIIFILGAVEEDNIRIVQHLGNMKHANHNILDVKLC